MSDTALHMKPEEKPVGACKAVSFAMRRPPNKNAVFVNVQCEDEAGKPFYFTAACFSFDLKPGSPPDNLSC